MISDKNKFSHISLTPKNFYNLPSYVYVGHPIKKIFEECNEEQIKEFTLFIENVAVILNKHGYTPLIPSMLGHNNSSKIIEVKEIYANCAKACRIACLFIAIPVNDSTGLGMEYQIALSNDIPIIALCDENKTVTGMINESTANIITYSCLQTALEKLDRHLSSNCYYNNLSYYSFDQV